MFSAFCRESWVIVPGLVVAYELFLARTTLRRAMRTGVLLAIPAGAYLLAYLPAAAATTRSACGRCPGRATCGPISRC